MPRAALLDDDRWCGTIKKLPVVDEPGRWSGDSVTRTMSPTSVRSIRRSVRWFTLKEYVFLSTFLATFVYSAAGLVYRRR
jgi:hypothetical protein